MGREFEGHQEGTIESSVKKRLQREGEIKDFAQKILTRSPDHQLTQEQAVDALSQLSQIIKEHNLEFTGLEGRPAEYNLGEHDEIGEFEFFVEGKKYTFFMQRMPTTVAGERKGLRWRTFPIDIMLLKPEKS